MVRHGNTQARETEQIVAIANRRKESDGGQQDGEDPLPAQTMRPDQIQPAEPEDCGRTDAQPEKIEASIEREVLHWLSG